MELRSIEVGSEVPDKNGTLYRIVADRRTAGPGETPVGGTEFPPIVAMCLGINVKGSPLVGDDGEIVQFFADGKAAELPFNLLPKADLDLVYPDIPPHDYDPDFFVEVGKEYRTRDDKKIKITHQVDEFIFVAQYIDPPVLVPNSEFTTIVSYRVWVTGKVGMGQESRDVMEPWLERNFWKFVYANPNNVLDKNAWSPFMNERPPRPWPEGKTLFHIHMRELKSPNQKFKLVKVID